MKFSTLEKILAFLIILTMIASLASIFVPNLFLHTV